MNQRSIKTVDPATGKLNCDWEEWNEFLALLASSKSLAGLGPRARNAILHKLTLSRARKLKTRPVMPSEVADLRPFLRTPNFGRVSQKQIADWLSGELSDIAAK